MTGSSDVAAVDLFWIPLGAGEASPLVRWSGRAFEALQSRLERRTACDLYHAALQVRLDGTAYAIEMTPVWGQPAGDRGVVAEGPVGMRMLGRSRFFRYEVRRWHDGVIPDLADAVGGPRRLSTDAELAALVLALLPRCPRLIWGRDQLGAGDMWNSNSLIAWALSSARLDTNCIEPPEGGRAPGWRAGLAATRQGQHSQLTDPRSPHHRHRPTASDDDVVRDG